MTHIATWLVLALVVGVFTKLVTPGRHVVSWTATPFLGAAGLLIGSQLARLVLRIDVLAQPSSASMVAATAGSIVVYVGYRLLFGAVPIRRSGGPSFNPSFSTYERSARQFEITQ